MDNKQDLLRVINKLCREKEFTAAEWMITQLMKMSDPHSVIHSNYALILQNQHKFIEAEKQYLIAILLRGDDCNGVEMLNYCEFLMNSTVL